MTRRDSFSPPPAFHVSVVRLACSACGAEANATCSCGQPYVPKRQRAEEIAEANPNISIRELAEQAKVSHGTAQAAKSRVQSRTPDIAPTVGRDGKTYSAPSSAIRPVTGHLEEPVIGRDGKSYPARQQRQVEPGGEIARLKRVYGEDLLPQPIQRELKDVAVGACEQMNLTTLQDFALDFDRIYWARRNKEGDA